MLPVTSETEMGIFRQILQAKLDFESEPWPSISDSAKDLIRKMLDRNPKKRLSAHEVLCKSSFRARAGHVTKYMLPISRYPNFKNLS